MMAFFLQLLSLVAHGGCVAGDGAENAAKSAEERTDDARSILAEMKRAARSARGISARCRVTQRHPKEPPYPMTSRLVWDRDRQRLLNSWGYVDAPYDHRSILVEDLRCITVDHLLQRRSVLKHCESPCAPAPAEGWSLEERLGLAGVDELWKVAFTAQLHETSTSAAGARPFVDGSEDCSGVPCDRIEWEGSECRLWVGKEDRLPRRLEGWVQPVGGRSGRYHLKIEVVDLEAAPIAPKDPRFQLPTSLPEDSPEQARKAWRDLRRLARKRPGAGERIPEFVARSSNGEPRGLDDLDERTLLVLWFSDSAAVLEGLRTLAEERTADPKGPHLVSIHFGDLPDDLDRFGDPSRHELWCSPVDSGGAHRRLGVYRCPAYFLIDSDGVIEASTRSVEEMRNHLDG